MDLSVSYKIASTQQDAFALAKAQITPEYVDKFNVKAEINYDEASGIMEATGKGFTLTLEFDDSKCDVNLKLSMLLRPLKKKILEKIEKKLSKHV
ncbi:polyhydroxyalkanoic acid system family protein [Halobacteriovorax sp. HLS]|uniref:polyhydroxyalkanoic acid system family protein n=1 Tax=Halobacteriovorax sp. HLS TaxID=2234000 RepID=UPI000FD6CB81|nr:polyhydroxyalkanoic acid system family protein [Halobacteriovorax sp. HLS]